MSETSDGFRHFFIDLNGQEPFPWQERLAERVCAQGWPRVIALPTGSGKTACLDIAVFALAHCKPGLAPRRIFYVVDRRLLVSEAYLRMNKICKALANPQTDSLRWARAALLQRAHQNAAVPLLACEMRGGAYRDESWVRTPLQPVVVSSTVDQVGSRLLFRGYGVSDKIAPIHASLAANDALILLDEAHAARAFAQTLAAVEEYRSVQGTETGHLPSFRFVEMTATPSREVGPAERFGLDDRDRADPELGRRLRAPKPVALETVKVKRDDFGQLAEQMVETAQAHAKAAGGAKRVAILCNRVFTARSAFGRLQKAGHQAVLVTGRMRPMDRAVLYERQLRRLKSGEARGEGDAPLFVVATQSLEVGADLDFDVLVSEIASLDAILQRFGRLNRMGRFEAGRGVIVCAPWHLETKKPDPVYMAAMKPTWEWLGSTAVNGRINLGLESDQEKTVPMLVGDLDAKVREGMTRLGASAPILLPAHLDALVQTKPSPEPDPDIALFLHGVEPVRAEAQVVWRADLVGESGAWKDLVEFCPPLAAEALPVPLAQLRRWLAGQAPADASDADVEGMLEIESDREPVNGNGRSLRGALWCNGEAEALSATELIRQLRPGATIVFPATMAASWPDDLGHIPEDRPVDLGDEAHWRMQRRVTLRIHPAVIQASQWPACRFRELCEAAIAKGPDLGGLDDLKDVLAHPGEIPQGWLCDLVSAYAERRLQRTQPAQYPATLAGFRLETYRSRDAPREKSQISLKQHLRDVVQCAQSLTAGGIVPSSIGRAVVEASERHDWGKIDPRFQARLRGGDALAARFAPEPLAKSGSGARAPDRSGLPDGFRHELLSYLLAERELTPDYPERDLVLHLIASHHGYCRPFAPVVSDPAPCDLHWNGTRITGKEIRGRPAHHLSHGIADRFWHLNRRFGWWGLAYLESMLRLADWEASSAEYSEVLDE